MSRINVYETDEFGDRRLAGWFDDETAEQWAEDTYWDGRNNCGVLTRTNTCGQVLYRTAGGRWVLREWSLWQGVDDSYRFLSEDQAREWLISCGYDAAITQHFDRPIEPERGPGRPEVGTPVNVRLGDELLAEVDAHAETLGVSRAEAIRRIVRQGLDTLQTTK